MSPLAVFSSLAASGGSVFVELKQNGQQTSELDRTISLRKYE